MIYYIGQMKPTQIFHGTNVINTGESSRIEEIYTAKYQNVNQLLDTHKQTLRETSIS